MAKNVPAHLRAKAKKCLFCGEPGLSLTHIWPDWLNRMYPGSAHVGRYVATEPTSPTSEERIVTHKNYQGSLFSRKPKLACIDCNTGWMKLFGNCSTGLKHRSAGEDCMDCLIGI
jgi:hypothetical protein